MARRDWLAGGAEADSQLPCGSRRGARTARAAIRAMSDLAHSVTPNGTALSTRAVILAGGKGTRLRPFTVNFPKPLVPVGDRPVLEHLLRHLMRSGITDITLALGHLAELIKAYFSQRTTDLAPLV